MRVVIIFLLLIVLGFIGWRAAEHYGLIEAPQEIAGDDTATSEGEDAAPEEAVEAESGVAEF